MVVFRMLRNLLHINYNRNILSHEQESYDKLFKVCPVTESVRNNMLKGESEDCNSIEEAMV
jgi:translation initiation factor 2 beta subunit (eIF-2beta)/eIF-5